MFKTFVEPFKHPYPDIDRTTLTPFPGKKPKARAKNGTKTLGRIWRYVAVRKLKLMLVLLMVLISSALSLLGPYLIGVGIDRFIAGTEGTRWGLFMIGLGAVYAGYSLSTWLQNIWMIEIAQETVYRMRRDLFHHLHRLPIPFFGRRQQGELMSRLTNDIDNVSTTLNSSAIQVFSSILTLLGTVGVMLYLSPILTLITFIIVPLMVLGMKWITRRTGPLFKERQKHMGELNGHIEETLSGQRIVTLFSQEKRVISEFRKRNEAIREAGFWAQTISGIIPKLMNGLNNLSFALVAGVGGILAIQGSVTVGTIVIFVEYARQFTRPLNDLANQWNSMLSAIAGAERVFEVLDEGTEDHASAESERIDHLSGTFTSAVSLDKVEGEVIFEQVSFAYDKGRDTLKDISFKAKPGEMIALVGPTGAGKTTLIQLLSRFYDPSEGHITIDGIDVTSIRHESLRSQMAFVLQDNFLFQGTIRDNIRFGRLNATDEEVEEASKLANAHSFIMRLPGGYDRLLDTGGSGISQGQRQLIAIARAILANPSILVLDEATSSIDTVTEIKIQEGLQRLMHGRTSFVIAHRLNTIRKADRILVLKQGRLIEHGTHDELLIQKGVYSDLYYGRISMNGEEGEIRS